MSEMMSPIDFLIPFCVDVPLKLLVFFSPLKKLFDLENELQFRSKIGSRKGDISAYFTYLRSCS
jgi:hypothetical protein